jgi:crossover junction endodeoxyribonuclease RuvC
MKTKIYLGIDQSLVATGWALVKTNKQGFTLFNYNLIRPGNLRGDERLLYIEAELKSIIKEHKPDAAAMEGFAFSRRGGMVYSLGELGWCIKRTLHKADIPYIVIQPSTLKKQITGNGRAQKPAVLKEARRLSGAKFGLVPKTKRSDVAEAFCLAYIMAIREGNIKRQ